MKRALSLDERFSSTAPRTPDGAPIVVTGALVALGLVLLIVLLRAIMFPRRTAAPFTPPVARD